MTIEQVGLSVSLEAELAKFDANMKKAGQLVNTTTTNMDKATKRAAKSFNQLEASLDPVSRAAQRLQRDVDKVRVAQEKGVITNERAAQSIARLNANYDSYTAKLGANTTALNRAGRAANDNAPHYRRFGGIAQQAGYQIGDFAVQVASGQNAVVALAQQASQLLGFFGPWGAVLGAAAAVVGALAVALWDVDTSADDAKDAIKDYEDAIKSAESFIKRLNDETKTSAELLRDERAELLANAKVRVEGAKTVLAAAKANLAAVRAQAEIDAVISGVGDADAGVIKKDRAVAFSEGVVSSALDDLNKAQKEFDALIERIDAAISKNEEFKASQESDKAAKKAASDADRQAEKIGNVVEALQNEIEMFGMSDRAIEINNALRRAGVDGATAQGVLIRQLAGDVYDYKQRIEDLNESLEREDRLMKEGVRVRDENRTAQEIYNDELQRLDMLLASNAISQETYSRAASRAFDEMAKAQSKVGTVGRDVGRVLTNSLSSISDWADDARGQVEKLADAFASLILQKSVMEPAADAIGGAIGSMDWGSFFAFADGGVMTKNGPLPLRTYSEGGIANSPQLAMFGETSVPEAYVPVPSGKIPVDIRMPKMVAQSSGPSQVNYISAPGADQAAIARLENVIRALGGEVRRIDNTFDARAVGAVANGARRGGSAARAIRGR